VSDLNLTENNGGISADNQEQGEIKKVYASNLQNLIDEMDDERDIIELENVTIRFNKNNLKVDNLKEYFVRLVTRQLMFQEFIALKNVNLTVKKGESWGLVGRNGAGKSTLLKVVSKILKPAGGTVKVGGTVAALIELGAGIDPQLTARENIFLNGTLLGYSKAYIESKFDEIVEFSELQDFLDSPVKNFSSGMKTRLAFSIATSVEPDILIADEILSVGDIRFKKKCSQKMTAMMKNGTTLLYVSHNLNSIRKQCQNAMWLDHGEVIMTGSADEVCDAFEAEMASDEPILLKKK
jgi:lipopolysaccharide transport system ATP-binding protein